MKKSIIFVTLIAALAMTGCKNNSVPAAKVETTTIEAATVTEAETTKADTAEAEKKTELKTIGKEKKGEKVFKVNLTNGTGKEIEEFSVKAGADAEFSENMLEKGDMFKADEERILYFDSEGISENEEGGSADAPLISTEYTIKLKFRSGETAELHQFPFGDIEAGEIKFEKDIAYIIYKSKSTGEAVTTKEAEEKINAPEDTTAAAATEAATEAQTQEFVPDATQAAETPVQQPVYTEPYVQEPVYTDPPATQPYVAPTEAPAPVTQAPTEDAGIDPDNGCGAGFLFN